MYSGHSQSLLQSPDTSCLPKLGEILALGCVQTLLLESSTTKSAASAVIVLSFCLNHWILSADSVSVQQIVLPIGAIRIKQEKWYLTPFVE